MYRQVGSVKLKSGEHMVIGVVEAPDKDYERTLHSFLSHKGKPWIWQIRECLAGNAGRLQSRFYIGELRDEIICNVMIVEHIGVGILGHVFTAPQHRRKGACNAVMKVALEDFRERNGKILILGTGYDSPAYWIYHRHGFRSIVEGSRYMILRLDEDYENELLRPAACKVEDIRWEQWSLAALLFMQREGDFLRSVRFGKFGACGFEGEFLQLLSEEQRDGAKRTKMLINEKGACCGLAFVSPDNRWRGHVHLLDFFVHPNYEEGAEELLKSVPLPRGKVQAYADADSKQRVELLERLGFEPEATLRNQIKDGSRAVDVLVFAKYI